MGVDGDPLRRRQDGAAVNPYVPFPFHRTRPVTWPRWLINLFAAYSFFIIVVFGDRTFAPLWFGCYGPNGAVEPGAGVNPSTSGMSKK